MYTFVNIRTQFDLNLRKLFLCRIKRGNSLTIFKEMEANTFTTILNLSALVFQNTIELTPPF